jgi:hypothetical protein
MAVTTPREIQGLPRAFFAVTASGAVGASPARDKHKELSMPGFASLSGLALYMHNTTDQMNNYVGTAQLAQHNQDCLMQQPGGATIVIADIQLGIEGVVEYSKMQRARG